MDILPEIKNRHSQKTYLDKPIEAEALKRILEAGRLAPSAKNRQPWRFLVLQNSDLRQKVAETAYGEEWVAKAPAILALCTTNIDYRMPNGIASYPVDIAFAASFMMLQAQHEGLVSCLNTTFQEEELRNLLTVPHSMRIVMLLILGYPADSEETNHNRLPLGRVVGYDHW